MRLASRNVHSADVVAFYNRRVTYEQWIKEGKGAIKWTRLSCCSFAANSVRLQLHALAYNLGNFLRTLATPEPIKNWSLTSLKEKLIKIGAKIVSHGRYVAFQMVEVARRAFHPQDRCRHPPQPRSGSPACRNVPPPLRSRSSALAT
jgi:Transposase DDE domain group 1